jgi:hypothetical protein
MRIMIWAVHVARVGERGVIYKILLGKPEGRRPLGRPMRQWEYKSIMDFQEV